MKRMQLIAAALCLIMIATVGAGVVVAKQQENPRQAGASSVYLYDVAATDMHGSGKLMIDVKEQTFVFNGKGFDPDTLHVLRYRVEGSTDLRVFASGKATPSGNLHVTGTWEKDAALPTTEGFRVSVEPWVGSSYGYVYYIPASGTRPTYYIFAVGTSAYWVNFYDNPPSPQDFNAGKTFATWTKDASGADVLIFANAKQFTVTLGYAHNVDRYVRTYDGVTYYLNEGIVTPAPVPLLGLPAGTFALGDTPVKLVVNGNFYDEENGHTNWHLVIFDPIQYSGAYTQE